jgi:hypothetical protein
MCFPTCSVCLILLIDVHATLFQVEEVFMTGDLPRVAEILSSMRKSLNLVRSEPGRV